VQEAFMTQAIVVTGASGGIGQACVSRLVALGFQVLAGVRSEAQASALPPGATPFHLDLSTPERIEEAVSEIRSFGLPLRGLVNNAGISRAGAIEDLPMEVIREVMEVDLFGPLELTRALLPSLRQTTGRIVNIGSGEGFLATPLNAPYCMAKHALEAFSESLRIELASSGIRVCVVSPGQTETAILRSARTELTGAAPSASAQYRPLFAPRSRMAERTGMPPERVARAVGDALTSSNPRERYFVGADSRGAYLLGRVAPAALRRRFMRRVLGFR
jgi:NAD(P)-dependent dehydrogenase (short-subunit alcohol dehydrogenase family)